MRRVIPALTLISLAYSLNLEDIIAVQDFRRGLEENWKAGCPKLSDSALEKIISERSGNTFLN